MDNIIIYAVKETDLLEVLKNVFNIYEEYEVSIYENKCRFFLDKEVFFGEPSIGLVFKWTQEVSFIYNNIRVHNLWIKYNNYYVLEVRFFLLSKILPQLRGQDSIQETI